MAKSSKGKKKKIDNRPIQFQNPEVQAKRIANLRKAVRSEESRAKTSASSKAMWADPETRAKITANIRKVQQTAEYKAKISAASKARWADPEYKERILAARRAKWEAHPEQKAALDEHLRKLAKENRKAASERMKAAWQDPKKRAKMTKNATNPKRSTRKKMSEAAQKRWQDPDYAANIAFKSGQTKHQKAQAGLYTNVTKILFKNAEQVAQTKNRIKSVFGDDAFLLDENGNGAGAANSSVGKAADDWDELIEELKRLES